jgi:hypothetical protein
VAVLLRQAVEADLPVLYEYQREPLAVAMAAFPARERDAFMAHWRTNVLGDPTTLTRVMVVDGQVVGYLLTWNGDGRRLLGYWVGERFWGRGIASQALALFVAEQSSGAHSARSWCCTTLPRCACSRRTASCASASPQRATTASTSSCSS